MPLLWRSPSNSKVVVWKPSLDVPLPLTVPLSDGRFACGRVLDAPKSGDLHVPANSRMFLAGLLNWAGSQPPTVESIAGASLIEQGFALAGDLAPPEYISLERLAEAQGRAVPQRVV